MQDLDGNPLDQARLEGDQDVEAELNLDSPTWVDDHAIFTIARDPNVAVHNVRTIMVTLHKVAARHGFCLNTKKGKTECVITFVVKGIMEAKRALNWQEDHAQLRCGDNGILRLAASTWARSTTDICAGSLNWFDVLRQRARSPSPGSFCATLLPLPVRRQAALACVDGVLFSAAGCGQLLRSVSSVCSVPPSL